MDLIASELGMPGSGRCPDVKNMIPADARLPRYAWIRPPARRNDIGNHERASIRPEDR